MPRSSLLPVLAGLVAAGATALATAPAALATHLDHPVVQSFSARDEGPVIAAHAGWCDAAATPLARYRLTLRLFDRAGRVVRWHEVVQAPRRGCGRVAVRWRDGLAAGPYHAQAEVRSLTDGRFIRIQARPVRVL